MRFDIAVGDPQLCSLCTAEHTPRNSFRADVSERCRAAGASEEDEDEDNEDDDVNEAFCFFRRE